MRKILFILLLLSSGLNAQTFSFECLCAYLTAADSNCDICNANIQSRLFKGILIRKNGTAFKWIDQPYIVQFQGNNATFRELIPNGENITITLAGTPFDSIPQYQDSIKCPCAGSENFFIAGPGIYFSGDTISAFDISPINELQTVDSFYISAGNLYISLDRDSVPASFVTLPVPTGAETIINAGTGISVTGSGTIGSPYVVTNTLPHIATDLTFSGASSPVTLNSSTGTDVTFTAGTGISLAATGTNTTITNSAPDQTVSITGAGINVVTGTYPNFTVTGTEVDGSTSNELQTYGHAGTTTYTNTLSGGGGSWSITGAGIAAISQTAGAITVTATEVDGSISNEGVLGIGAGSGTSSTLLSTTSGANAVTINAAGILGISESTSANGGSITLTATEVDGSTTNELQTLANTSNSTSHTATLSNSGGSLQLVEGANITLTTTGATLDGIVTIAGNAGTVTSVGLALPTSVFDISGSPVTSSGTLTAAFDNQSANTVFAGPTTGGAATPAFRALVAADITTGGGVVGTGVSPRLTIWSGTNTVTSNAAFQYLLGADDYRIIINGARNDRFGKSFQINSSTAVENLGVTDDGSTNIRGVLYQGKTPATYYGFTQGQINIFSKFSMYETGLAYVDAVADKFRFLTFVEPSQDYLKFRSVYGVGNGIGGTAGDTYTDLFIVKADGKFGILTTSPTQELDVNGDFRLRAGFYDGANTIGTSGYVLSSTGAVTSWIPVADGSATNELQTLAHTSNSTSHTATLSSSGGSIQLIEGSGVLLTTGGTGLNGTVTIEAIDPSTTNEIQTLSASGAGPTSYNIDLTSSGTSVTLSEGSGIDLTRSGNTITVASTAASAWILDGNTITSAKRIGSNDNFDVVVETNGTDRVWFDNGGTVSIGATQLTTAALNINGLQGGIGQLIAGGSGLTAPNFYQATGSGSGSTATVFSGVISMLNGNVESLIQNTSTSGSGGVVMQLNAKTATGDPRLYMTIDGTTDWSIGIDNDDVDNLKLHRFAAPSDNNGEGTIEFGYDGTMIGMGINKTGIGTATNGYYALDIFGKTRADQFVNNRYDITSTPVATMAVGTAAGTSPTVDNTVTSVWGNAARLKFTSGSSPTANGVVCTITLGTEYTFNECIPIMQGRSTNAGAFNYSCSYDSGTRVITCTLVGTLTASTVYEFNIIFLGRN